MVDYVDADESTIKIVDLAASAMLTHNNLEQTFLLFSKEYGRIFVKGGNTNSESSKIFTSLKVTSLMFLLGDVEKIISLNNAWALILNDDHYPEVLKAFNGDLMKAHRWIVESYGSVGQSPYKTDVLSVYVEGELSSMVLTLPIKRGKLDKIISIDKNRTFMKVDTHKTDESHFSSFYAKLKVIKDSNERLKKKLPNLTNTAILVQALKTYNKNCNAKRIVSECAEILLELKN